MKNITMVEKKSLPELKPYKDGDDENLILGTAVRDSKGDLYVVDFKTGVKYYIV